MWKGLVLSGPIGYIICCPFKPNRERKTNFAISHGPKSSMFQVGHILLGPICFLVNLGPNLIAEKGKKLKWEKRYERKCMKLIVWFYFWTSESLKTPILYLEVGRIQLHMLICYRQVAKTTIEICREGLSFVSVSWTLVYVSLLIAHVNKIWIISVLYITCLCFLIISATTAS